MNKLTAGLLITLILATSTGIYFYTTQNAEIAELTSQNERLTEANNELNAEISSLNQQLTDRDQTITMINSQLKEVTERLEDEEARLSPIRQTLSTVAEDVARQDKLASIDPELLQKYSRVYFLNENYVPSSLSTIPEEWTFKNEQFHTRALPFLTNMLTDAQDDGVKLAVASAYRSFDRQQQIKQQYQVIYGEGANQFSADQGYSEHQLGTTVDITSAENEYQLTESFENTTAFEWLSNNADKYGFVMSYPPNNEYYDYEPWHWRFVGTELADQLADNDAYLYELDERQLQEFRLELFD